MKLKLTTKSKTSVKVSQKVTQVKYIVGGSLLIALIGAAAFAYLNFGASESAEAGANPSKMKEKAEKSLMHLKNSLAFVDLSHLSIDEMHLLNDRNFIRDTVRKEYTSVKWLVNNSMSHLTLEVSNVKYEYSLELYDMNGTQALSFSNLREEKFFVDKMSLLPNHPYNYVIRNSIGDIYAGNLRF